MNSHDIRYKIFYIVAALIITYSCNIMNCTLYTCKCIQTMSDKLCFLFRFVFQAESLYFEETMNADRSHRYTTIQIHILMCMIILQSTCIYTLIHLHHTHSTNLTHVILAYLWLKLKLHWCCFSLNNQFLKPLV